MKLFVEFLLTITAITGSTNAAFQSSSIHFAHKQNINGQSTRILSNNDDMQQTGALPHHSPQYTAMRTAWKNEDPVNEKIVVNQQTPPSPTLPELNSITNMYTIKSEEEYYSLLKANPDKLVVVKFFSSYCRACKALTPKLMAVKNDKQLEGLPIVWAEFQSQRSNKDLFSKLEVIALPTIHFYDGSRGLVENFPCPPTEIPQLKKKLARFLNSRVDPETLQLKDELVTDRTEPRVNRGLANNEFITTEHIDYLRNGLPFFKDLTDAEFDQMLQKASLLSFNPGDVIMKQGMPGTTFYVLKRGVVEMSIKSRFDDPIATPSNYLGVAVSRLKKGDYFGERSLTTGEPYAASFRVLEKVRCFAFNVEDIPDSSILSKKQRATPEMIDQLSERYELPADYTPNYRPETPKDECILELLVRFKQIRQAAKCFDYIMESEPNWGDEREILRRSMLVRKLSWSQRNEFNEVFSMVDVNHNGQISLLEMRKFMESARKAKTDAELNEMIDRANPKIKGKTDQGISRDEFMGVMAEAEFYNLFKETFQELEREDIGYVRAGDLDEVLHGVRSLISEGRKTSIIDVDDKDMLVDYEQFTKMVIGAAL